MVNFLDFHSILRRQDSGAGIGDPTVGHDLSGGLPSDNVIADCLDEYAKGLLVEQIVECD